MEPDGSAILEVRRRLLEDYSFYAPNVLKIRTKDSKVVPFAFNEAQRLLGEAVEKQRAATGRVRIIILKARQMGLSTYVGGRLFFRVSQNSGRKALVVTHRADSTRALFDMTKRFYKECPKAVQPSTKYSSRKELFFDRLDSGYMVATAGGDDIGRGETITEAHLSELAFWPPGSAQENFSGLMDAIPNQPGTEVYIESTANGVSGIFYEQWMQAVQGKSGFVPVFLPWFLEPGYVERVPEGFEESPEELELVGQFGLSREQLVFRRRKIAEKGRDLFVQEYPSTAEEAFLTTGRPVFNPVSIDLAVRAARGKYGVKSVENLGWEPQARYALEGEKWRPNSRGDLYVYHDHDPAETYYVGADVGMGVQRDWSVAQVLDSKRRQVATFRGQVDPDYFATILLHLGRLYNDCLVAPESNNHGILTCTRLAKDFNYPNVYTERVYDKLTDAETVKIGFQTNSRTKPLIIDKLRASVREDEVEINDWATLSEMRTFIVTEEGKMEAERGTHDDCVMALAIANFVHEGAFELCTNIEELYPDYSRF